MSILLVKVLLFRVNTPLVAENITDMFDLNVGRGLDIKNNIIVMNLRNDAISIRSDGTVSYNYVDASREIIFEEQDQIKLYVKNTNDMADIGSDAWNKTSSTEPGNEDLMGVYYLIEFNVKDTIKGGPIKLKCADKTYIIFNKLLAEAFLESDALKASTMIQKVVRRSSQNPSGLYLGTGADAGVTYDIDARLDSETSGGDGTETAGFIQSARKATRENGDANADLTFPTITFAKVWKPIYEWIGELSQIENLNTTEELGGVTASVVYGRPFLFYVDELNKFHWFETDNVVNETITIGTTTGIIDYNLDKKVFDTVNFIIFRGGEDMFGKGTLWYFVDETSNVKTDKMRVIGMQDITKTMIQDEINEGNLVSNTSGTFVYKGNRYNRNGSVTPTWKDADAPFASDSSYNDSLIKEFKRQGQIRSRRLTSGLARARFKGKLDRRGVMVTVGSLLNVTNNKTGQASELIRVMDVRHTINKTGWFTSMQIEQDQTAIIEGDVFT